MTYRITPPAHTDEYPVSLFVTCRWTTFLKDGTQADFEKEFEGFPTEAQCVEGEIACVEFARGQELHA
jgi:hypothetical protein